jgi:hypothetical protein
MIVRSYLCWILLSREKLNDGKMNTMMVRLDRVLARVRERLQGPTAFGAYDIHGRKNGCPSPIAGKKNCGADPTGLTGSRTFDTRAPVVLQTAVHFLSERFFAAS